MRQPVSELRVPSAEDCHSLERGLPFPHRRPGSWKQAKSKDGLRRAASAVIYRRAKSRDLSREPFTFHVIPRITPSCEPEAALRRSCPVNHEPPCSRRMPSSAVSIEGEVEAAQAGVGCRVGWARRATRRCLRRRLVELPEPAEGRRLGSDWRLRRCLMLLLGLAGQRRPGTAEGAECAEGRELA